MEFKIDLKNIVKIVTEKDGKRIEYKIKDGVITDATVVDEQKVVSDKIDELKATNENVKKIQDIIKLDDELDRIVKLKRDEIAEEIQLSNLESKEDKEDKVARIAYLQEMIKKLKKDD